MGGSGVPTTTGVREPTSAPTARLWGRHIALMLLGPVSLAIAGSRHPAYLNADTADSWHTLHVVLLVLFPLLAATVWVLVRRWWSGLDGLVATAARMLALAYAVFYGALDVLAGIANGAIVRDAASGGGDVAAPRLELFRQGDMLGAVGTWSLLGAFALTAVLYLRHHGIAAVPGSVVLLAAAYSFRTSHVFPWRGVVTMLAFGVGALLLALPELRHPPA
ncbi:MAG: hypothetical protein ACR2KL_10735 [Nocardioidaceae bacterium]